ncbi:polymorphic toxin type 10 domain-containing protein, partial [Nitrosomonas sp.]|uniref:polymorphic toxin type 10 domain-containing protein n=1 Tax=Nitrosomonas sp. TaxID=42353 RepID=UPI001D4203F7
GVGVALTLGDMMAPIKPHPVYPDAIESVVTLPGPLGKIGSSKKLCEVSGNVTNGINNPVPRTLARVVPDTVITRASGTLGKPNVDDVFVTAADDIRGLDAKKIAKRLTIPASPTGFRVIEFPTPRSGIASPVNRTDPGFVGGGRTAGGAREFIIPNGSIPVDSNARVVR